MVTLIVGDTHFPFVHPDYLEFLRGVQKKWGVEATYHIGDVFDWYGLSSYPKDADSSSVVHEADAAIEGWGRFRKALKIKKVVAGNHDTRLYARYNQAGIPSLLRPPDILERLYGVPVVERINLSNNITVLHGWGGKTFGHAEAIRCGRSIVAGHHHTHAGVHWLKVQGTQLFVLQVGCGIEANSLAFRYTRSTPMLGCGLLIDGHPLFIPMEV